MRRLFLTSQVQYVASSIAAKLGDEINQPTAFINTCLQDKERTDAELSWHFANKNKLEEAGFQLDMYDISSKSLEELKRDLAKYKIMYIEGGNTFYLLKQAQANNFAAYLKERINAGLIYISTSAGSIVAGPDVHFANRPGKTAKDWGVTDEAGFNLVNFVIMPHWGDSRKKEMYLDHKILDAYQVDYPYIPLNDNQYIEVEDEKIRIIDVSDTLPLR